MSFCAVDFKTDPATGELAFLEANTSPMFARFDAVSEGRLCEAMVHQLMKGSLDAVLDRGTSRTGSPGGG